jgi:hypothetical protein
MTKEELLDAAIASADSAVSGVESAIRTLDTWVLVFAALVAIGVLGESILGIWHWVKDRELRPLRVTQAHLHENKLELLRNATAQLSKDAETAKGEIAHANERAGNANAEAGRANERAEVARASAAAANERIEKMRLLRTLTKSQTDTLAPFLKQNLQLTRPELYIPTVGVASVADTEAQMYAIQFINLFIACGVNIYPTKRTPEGGSLPREITQLVPSKYGLMLAVGSKNGSDIRPGVYESFVGLQKALQSIGLDVPLVNDDTMRFEDAQLNVLRKPDTE